MLHLLPEDLLRIVLSKLSVQSLFRFRCVSKLWLKLIDSPYLVNLNLNYNEQNSTKIMILGNNHPQQPRSISFYTLDFNSLNIAKPKAIMLEVPPLPYPNDVTIEICNSLICFVSKLKKRAFIWNPATRGHREVVLGGERDAIHRCGFGYDYKTDDYKLVLRFHPTWEETHYTFQVYSLKSNTWGRDKKICVFGKIRSPVYADGALYWIARRPTRDARGVMNKIFFFDLATEQWHMLQPAGPITDVYFYNMRSHGRSLCVNCYNLRTRHTEFLVLRKEGINCSWSKLATIKDSRFLKDLDITPIWNLKEIDQHNALIITNGGDRMKLYDTKKQCEIEDFDILGVHRAPKSFTWYESLVQL